jgi:hypothetical protein
MHPWNVRLVRDYMEALILIIQIHFTLSKLKALGPSSLAHNLLQTEWQLQVSIHKAIYLSGNELTDHTVNMNTHKIFVYNT